MEEHIKILMIHPEKCNDCSLCESACIQACSSLTSPGLSCIKILGRGAEDPFFPIACKQCENPPCMEVCPKSAICQEGGRVLIDRIKCVGCGTCVPACPFGAVKVDKKTAKSFKCDLCGGSPECVKVCEPGALEYRNYEMLSYPNMVGVAQKFARLMK